MSSSEVKQAAEVFAKSHSDLALALAKERERSEMLLSLLVQSVPFIERSVCMNRGEKIDKRKLLEGIESCKK